MKKIMVLSVIFTACMYVSASAAIVVISAKGDASYQAGGQWKPMTKGLTLAEGTKISTGVNSSAVLNIDDHIVTVKPMTSIKIYKNASSASTSDNSIGLQFGSVQAKIKKTAAVKTRFNITTPVATSSVRGTEEIVSYGPIAGMKIEVIEGAIRAFNDSGVSTIISGREKFIMGDAQSRPESLLSDVKDSATVTVTPDNATQEEKDAIDQSGGDNLFAGAETRNTEKTTSVNVEIIWPGTP